MARPNDHGDFGAAEDPDHYGASDPAADRYMDESMAEDVGDFGVDDESTFGYASVTSSVTRETLGGGTATQAPSVVSRGETTANGGADVESSSGDTEIRRSMSSNRSDAALLATNLAHQLAIGEQKSPVESHKMFNADFSNEQLWLLGRRPTRSMQRSIAGEIRQHFFLYLHL